MTDLFIEGPDALRLLSDVGVNTFANFGVGKAKQFVAVNPDGHLIGDAILFHLEEELFDLVGHPMVIDWVTFNLERGDYQATVERDDNSAVRDVGAAQALPVRAPGPDRRRPHRAGERRPAARREVLQHGRVHHRRSPRPRAAARHGRPARLRAVRPLGGRGRRPLRAAGGREGPRPRAGRRQGLLDGQPGVRLGARADDRALLRRPADAGVPGVAAGRRRSAPSAAAWTRPTSATTTSPRTRSATARRSSSTTSSSAGRRWSGWPAGRRRAPR